MQTNREIRFLRGRIELRQISATEKSAGYIGAVDGFIPYNSDSREMRDGNGRRFVERVTSGAFARSLSDAAHIVFADVGHNDAATFARRGVNLTLKDAPGGLSYHALVPDTNVGRDLLTNVRLGIIDGTSFEFEVRAHGGRVVGEDWSTRGDLAVRTIKDATLFRVNPVTEPAYLETSLAARSCQAFSAAHVPCHADVRLPVAEREAALRIFCGR